jgi:hypothetical protein
VKQFRNEHKIFPALNKKITISVGMVTAVKPASSDAEN